MGLPYTYSTSQSSPVKSAASFFSTPGLSYSTGDLSSSSPSSLFCQRSSSPIDPHVKTSSLSSPMGLGLSIHDQFEAPAITPAPGPANRKRLGYISRRLNRSKRRSIKQISHREAARKATTSTKAATEEEKEGELLEDSFDPQKKKNVALSPSPVGAYKVEKLGKYLSTRTLNAKESDLQGLLNKKADAIPKRIFGGRVGGGSGVGGDAKYDFIAKLLGRK